MALTHGPFDYNLDFLETEGLGEIVVGPHLDGLQSDILGPMPGNDNDVHAGVDLLEKGQRVDTRHSRQSHIEEQKLVWSRTDLLQGFFGGVCQIDEVPGLPERLRKRVSHA